MLKQIGWSETSAGGSDSRGDALELLSRDVQAAALGANSFQCPSEMTSSAPSATLMAV